jgi:hypothetical protein
VAHGFDPLGIRVQPRVVGAAGTAHLAGATGIRPRSRWSPVDPKPLGELARKNRLAAAIVIPPTVLGGAAATTVAGGEVLIVHSSCVA